MIIVSVAFGILLAILLIPALPIIAGLAMAAFYVAVMPVVHVATWIRRHYRGLAVITILFMIGIYGWFAYETTGY